jgi:hypothetical protein
MKRRNFIKNTTLIAAASGFLPQLFAATHKTVEIVSIPQGLPQIRHGLLLPQSGQQLLNSCPWLGKVDFQHFLRNGLEEDEKGMEHYSLELSDQKIQLAFEGEDIWLSCPEQVQKLSWSQQVESQGFRFHFIKTAQQLEDYWQADSLTMVVEGEVQLQDQVLKKGQLAYWKPTNQLSIAAETALVFICPV